MQMNRPPITTLKRLRCSEHVYIEDFLIAGTEIFHERPKKVYVREEDYIKIIEKKKQSREQKINERFKKWVEVKMQKHFQFSLWEIDIELLRKAYSLYCATEKSKIALGYEYILLARKITIYVPKNLHYHISLMDYLSDVANMQKWSIKILEMLNNSKQFQHIYDTVKNHIDKYLEPKDLIHLNMMLLR